MDTQQSTKKTNPFTAAKRGQDNSITTEQPPNKVYIDIDRLKVDIERYQRDCDVYKKENHRLQCENKRLQSIVEQKSAETDFYMALSRLKDIEIKLVILKLKNGQPLTP